MGENDTLLTDTETVSPDVVDDTIPIDTEAVSPDDANSILAFPGATVVGSTDEKVDNSAGELSDFPGSTVVNEESDIVEPVIAGVVGGATESTGIFAGMTAGAKAAFLATSAIPHPVPRAIITVGGSMLGGVGGYLAAKEAREKLAEINLSSGAPLTYKTIDDVPPRLRAPFVFGENVGQGIPFMGGTVALAKTGFRTLSESFVGKIFNGIMDAARDRMKIFLAGESVSVLGAASSGATSEAFLPGQVGPRMTAEVVGGIFAPGRLVVNGAAFLFTRSRQVMESLTPAARETAAARLIQSAFAEAGEDPVLAARLLRDAAKSLPEGVTPTSAQLVPFEAMVGLETALIASNRKFSVEAANRAQSTMDAYKDVIRLLRGTGDPAALREAAILQERYFRTLMIDNINEVKRIALQAAEKISPDNSGARAILSENVFLSASKSLKQSRQVEKNLWDLVPIDIDAKSNHITRAFTDLRARMLPDEATPKIITDSLIRLGEASGETNIGFLKLFRSRMLAMAREAGSNPERANEASMYGHLAEAALDDIDAVFKGPNDAVLRTFGVATEAYDNARQFSAALHDAFTNSFTGQNLQQGRRGLRLAPEALMKRALAGGGEVSAYRLRELEEAVRFLPQRGLGGEEAIENLDLMMEVQERFLAIVASDAVVNAETGVASTKAIADFIQKSPELMNRFPAIKTLLETAATSQSAANNLVDVYKKGAPIVRKRSAFAKLAGTDSQVFESPIDAVRSALNGRSPIRDLTALAKVGKRGGEEAVAGFRATVFDHAFREASTPSGLDFKKLRSVLFDPSAPGKPSAIDIMLKQDTIDVDTVSRLNKILSKADDVAKAAAGGGIPVDPDQGLDGMVQLLIRAQGAKMATSALGKGGGSSLIIAAGGAKLAEQVLARIPNNKIAQILIEAAEDPELMATLLTKNVGKAEGLEVALKLHSLMVRLGMMTVTPLAIGGVTEIPDIVDVEVGS